MKLISIATATLRTDRLRSLMAPGNLSNPANPSSLQITNRLVARGAGGRGEALRSAAPRQRSQEVLNRGYNTICIRTESEASPPPLVQF